MRTRSRLVAAVALLAVMGIAASCAPPPAPSSQTWTFRGTQVTVDKSQDETCIIICLNREDEPYLINIAFRVRLGEANSASVQVINAQNHAFQNVPVGATRTTSGGSEAKVNWSGIKPLDLLDLTNSDNKLEIVGVYSWGSEEDFLGVNSAANTVANILRGALNETVAKGSLPSDPSFILDLVLDNIFGALGLLAGTILPDFGLTDDVLGGGLFIGIGAKGVLADIIDGSIGSAPPITFDVPFLKLPPDIQGGGIFTMDSTSDFTQTYAGHGGRHTWGYQVAQA